MESGVVNEQKTTINNSIIIEGDIQAKEHLIINGTITGNIDIRGFNLFLGPGGKIEGEIRAKNVRIRGHMKGDIVATGTIEVTKEADFFGKISSRGISIEHGAYLDAYVDSGKKHSGTLSSKKTPTEISTAKSV